MDRYECIRMLERTYGKSIRHIARETGHSRVTIRKALKGVVPAYRRQQEIRRPVMDAHADIIDEWLVGDEERPKKQRHTAKRIFDRLVEEHGFDGACSTVRRHVRERREALGLGRIEAMVPLVPEMGVAEMDWGEVTIELGGEMVKAKMFCMRSRYSGASFVQVYFNERQEMLLDGHIRAFAFFGGVFPVIVYDNLKTVVKRVLQGKARLEQRAFHKFRSYYTFEARFCNVARGNEKGGVEGLVKFSRRNFLVPIPKVDTLEELNEKLLEQCQAYNERVLSGREDKRSVGERAEEERQGLLKLIEPYENTVLRESKVNKYQMVQCDGNRYSVPGGVGKKAQIHVGCRKIEIYLDGRKVAEHERSFQRDHWVMNPCHYLRILERKVAAFDSAKPIVEWRKHWPTSYDKLLGKLRERHGQAEGTREFLGVLRLHETYDADEIETAVELALEKETTHLEGIQLIITDQKLEEGKLVASLDPNLLRENAQIEIAEPDIAKYDELGVVA